jgi:hypothetical protein
MEFGIVFPLITSAALVFSLVAFGYRLRMFSKLPRPVDRSESKGKPQAGVLYAFTWGMMPWAKESTRLHWVAYLRGVAFHLGIFLGLAVLVASPWVKTLPNGLVIPLGVGTALGAGLGFAGYIMRFLEHNLRALSTKDDYFAVFLVSSFLASESLWLFGLTPAWVFYLVSSAMLVYAPLGKIRHCIYYAYSRLFYGRFMGRRAVLPHAPKISTKHVSVR